FPKSMPSMEKFAAEQPLDKSGRALIDCKGFAMISGAILGAVKDGAKPRFETYYGTGGGGHECAIIFDKSKGQFFGVNNDMKPGDPADTAGIVAASKAPAGAFDTPAKRLATARAKLGQDASQTPVAN